MPASSVKQKVLIIRDVEDHLKIAEYYKRKMVDFRQKYIQKSG